MFLAEEVLLAQPLLIGFPDKSGQEASPDGRSTPDRTKRSDGTFLTRAVGVYFGTHSSQRRKPEETSEWDGRTIRGVSVTDADVCGTLFSTFSTSVLSQLAAEIFRPPTGSGIGRSNTGSRKRIKKDSPMRMTSWLTALRDRNTRRRRRIQNKRSHQHQVFQTFGAAARGELLEDRTLLTTYDPVVFV